MGINIDANMVMQGLLFLLAGIGSLIMMQLNGMKKQLSVLPKIESDLAVQQTNSNNHGKQLEEIKERVGAVETHVNNQERIAILEQKLNTAYREIDHLRFYRHWSTNALVKLSAKVEVELPPQTEPRLTDGG